MLGFAPYLAYLLACCVCAISSLDDKTCVSNDDDSENQPCNANLEACTACGGHMVKNVTCPTADTPAVKLTTGTTRRVLLPVMDQANVVCMLWRVQDGRRQPVARSYEGYAWEASAVPAFGYLQFDCDDAAQTCQAELPPIQDNDYYEILSLERPALPMRDEAARFFEQTTFGPRLADLQQDGLVGAFSSFAAWIRHQQVDVPLTSHRRFVRERLNHRAVAPSPMGVPTHACRAGTRYRRYAFSDKDATRTLQIETSEAGNQKILSIDGQIRTVLPVEQLYAGPINRGIIFEDGL